MFCGLYYDTVSTVKYVVDSRLIGEYLKFKLLFKIIILLNIILYFKIYFNIYNICKIKLLRNTKILRI